MCCAGDACFVRCWGRGNGCGGGDCGRAALLRDVGRLL